MSTTSTRKKKRVAKDQHTDRDNKQQKQLSTDLKPFRSYAGLRARLRAQEEAAARSLITTNQEQSPFLRLPGEIRVRIYEFTLGGNLITPDYVRKTDVTPGRVAHYRTNAAAMNTFRSVIMSCRAVQAETELVLYTANIFCFTFDYDLTPWFRLLDEKKRAAIRTVWINYGLPYNSILWPMSCFCELPNIKMVIIWEDIDLSLTKLDVLGYAQAMKWQVVFEKA